MAATSARTLRLLSLLQTHRSWSGPELADRLGVSVRTLRRDVDRLRELGYPVEAQRGVDGGYQLAAGASMPPLVLDDEEAVALAIGLHAAAQGAIAGIEDSSVRALAKVVQVMPARLRHRIDALRSMTVPAVWSTAGPTVDPHLLATLAQSCRDEELLRFAYTARDSAQTDRRVEPHRLVSLGRRWYLVAFDLDRVDWRTFRVDRICDARNNGHRFVPRPLPGGDPAAFVRAGIDNLPASYDVEVRVHAPAEVVRERVGRWCEVEGEARSVCKLRMKADSLDWPTMALGMVNADFEVLSPPDLVHHVSEWGARFARSTSGR